MNITFFYPSIELGGAELLFARMAIYLSKENHLITVIDSEKKIIFDLCKDHNILRKTVGVNERVKVDKTYLVAFANNAFNLNNYLELTSDVKILFWNVHPLNVIISPSFIPRFILNGNSNLLKKLNSILFRSIYNNRRSFIDKALRKKSFLIMDGECCSAISNHYSLPIDTTKNVFLPVPINISSCERWEIKKVDINGPVNIFWYGRLCDFKIHSLVKVINEIKTSNIAFKLHIIGDGDKANVVIKKCLESKVDFNFYGRMNNSDALKLIASKAQCVFAMGTSALECASLGLPTILAPVSYKPIEKSVRYEWLYETKQYTLGRFIREEDRSGNVGLECIIKKMLADYEKISIASKQYVKSNHDISVIAEQLLKNLNSQLMTPSDLIIEDKGLIYKLYHILRHFILNFKKVSQ
jgi:glycosyltransferase involved in cell wall biosynthesis